MRRPEIAPHHAGHRSSSRRARRARARPRAGVERNVVCYIIIIIRINWQPDRSSDMVIAARLVASLSAPMCSSGMTMSCWPSAASKRSLKRKQAGAFLRAGIAAGEKPRQAAIGGAVLRKTQNIGRAVAKDQPAPMARRKPPACCSSCETMRAHDAGQRIAIGDPDAGEPLRHRRRDKFFRVRGAAQKGEIRRRRQLGVAMRNARHAKRPCMNQRGRAVSLTKRPSRNTQNLRPSVSSARK